MTPGVRLRDGVEVEFASGETVVLDGAGAGDATVLSHAHGDHLVGEGDVVTAELTADLAAVRRDGRGPTAVDHPAVELFPAGHVAGSRAARLTDPETGRRYLYTGDCSTRDRFYLRGFEPPDADVLIVESTYGRPEYRFPPTAAVVTEIRDWLADTMDRPVLLFGYALGRAQKLQRILADSARDRVFVTQAVAALNEVVADHLDVSFPAERYGSDVDLGPGDALVLPMQTGRLAWIESLVEATDAVTAGFSGWARDRSFVFRRGYDEGFVLSDHCDFDELVDVVRTVDPERVYTHHGFADEFADHLTAEYGYETRALKRNQATLADF
ncbi:MAG: MBL fold metallo-hydrolase RNA specificity domain-containing protein [Halanaeroarchaeum sp.]